MMCGPATKYLLSALSKRQTAVSHSTPEAEIIAAALALRTEALPQMTIWEAVLRRPMYLRFAEDNEAMIKICKSGFRSIYIYIYIHDMQLFQVIFPYKSLSNRFDTSLSKVISC